MKLASVVRIMCEQLDNNVFHSAKLCVFIVFTCSKLYQLIRINIFWKRLRCVMCRHLGYVLCVCSYVSYRIEKSKTIIIVRFVVVVVVARNVVMLCAYVVSESSVSATSSLSSSTPPPHNHHCCRHWHRHRRRRVCVHMWFSAHVHGHKHTDGECMWTVNEQSVHAHRRICVFHMHMAYRLHACNYIST